MDNEKQKPRKKKKSSIPIYAVGLVWISYAIEGKLTSFGGVIGCAALSLAAYFVLKLIFPDRMEEAEKQPEQKPAETQPAQKPQPEPRKAEPQASASTGNPELDAVLQQGQASVQRIQELNDAIPDFKLSAQLKQLEILTQKIFDYVRQHPENLRQIRQFLNYYLPTTIKLLEQYVVLQNQGMRVGNIDEGMTKIENMLEKVIAAFQQQLDSLFENDVVDITAEIRVMEKMMASEGLAGTNDFK